MKILKTVLQVSALAVLSVACTDAEIDLTQSNLTHVEEGETSEEDEEEVVIIKDCSVTPKEFAGTFPIKNPESLIRKDITDGKEGVKLIVNLIVKSKDTVLNNATVDLWHCDADGNYSQFGDFTDENFLRGRQTTDSEGKVSFTTIYPGWEAGRAPHIYLEVKKADGTSKVTQIALPQESQDKVYSTSLYTKGNAEVTNENDKVFQDSLKCNLPDETETDVLEGGYLIRKTIKL